MNIRFGPRHAPSIIGLIIGILLAVIGISSLSIRYMKMQTYETTQGRVIDMAERQSTTKVNGRRKTTVSYTPIYEYKVDGVTYKYQSNVYGNSSSLPEIGTFVKIYYNPENPEDALAKRSMLFEIIFIVMGLLAIFGYISDRIKYRKESIDEANNTPPPSTY